MEKFSEKDLLKLILEKAKTMNNLVYNISINSKVNCLID